MGVPATDDQFPSVTANYRLASVVRELLVLGVRDAVTTAVSPTAAKTQAAIEDAKREHDERASTIKAQRAAIDKQSQAEDARWQKQKEKLDIALRRIGGR